MDDENVRVVGRCIGGIRVSDVYPAAMGAGTLISRHVQNGTNIALGLCGNRSQRTYVDVRGRDGVAECAIKSPGVRTDQDLVRPGSSGNKRTLESANHGASGGNRDITEVLVVGTRNGEGLEGADLAQTGNRGADIFNGHTAAGGIDGHRLPDHAVAHSDFRVVEAGSGINALEALAAIGAQGNFGGNR